MQDGVQMSERENLLEKTFERSTEAAKKRPLPESLSEHPFFSYNYSNPIDQKITSALVSTPDPPDGLTPFSPTAEQILHGRMFLASPRRHGERREWEDEEVL